MRRRVLIAAVLVGVVVVTLATSAVAARRIQTSGRTWVPARVTVAKGTRVAWQATSGNHTVTAYGGNWSFDQGISAYGDPTAARTFRRVGRYRFRCRFHSTLSGGVCSGMCGRVRVSG